MGTPTSRAKSCLGVVALMLAGCTSGPGGATPNLSAPGGSDHSIAQEPSEEAAAWEPVFEGGVLQPLPDGFPSEPITLLNVAEAGSDDGLYARVIQRAAEGISPVPVNVLDRPTPNVQYWEGIDYAANEPNGAEGYISMVTSFPAQAIDLLVDPITDELGYTIEDLTPVIATERVPFVLITRADAPWTTYEEMVEHAQANPGELRYISLGVGSQLDLAMESLMISGGYEARKIPLEGVVDVTTTVAAGEGDFALMVPDVAVGQYEAGNLEVLLAVGDTAPEPWTDATTTEDLGLDEPWGSLRGFVVPPGVNELHVLWLHELFRAAAQAEAYEERIANVPGAVSIAMPTDEVREAADRIFELADPVVRELGLHHEQQ